MRQYLLAWIDSYSYQPAISSAQSDVTPNKGIDWLRIIPFIALHILALGVFWVGFSWVALAIAVFMYAIRMFAITGFYHRYFAHKTFKTSRPMQFLFAFIGSASAQKGPLWWAGHHRQHHRFSDTDNDVHSPKHGFLRSHVGWFLSRENFQTPHQLVKDWAKYPELVFLDRFALVAPLAMIGLIYLLGLVVEHAFPALETSALQVLIWGFFFSTVCLLHATLLINSMAHRVGKRRYQTRDDSRNNFWLALITFGEGWHNNHHFAPASVRQGFHWWQIDLTYYGLWIFKKLGLIWDMRPVPLRAYEQEPARAFKQNVSTDQSESPSESS